MQNPAVTGLFPVSLKPTNLMAGGTSGQRTKSRGDAGRKRADCAIGCEGGDIVQKFRLPGLFGGRAAVNTGQGPGIHQFDSIDLCPPEKVTTHETSDSD